MKQFLHYGLAFSLTSLLSVGVANAQNGEDACYPAEVISFDQGLKSNGNLVPADRSIPERALGAPDASNAAGGFVSLGEQGSITLGFDGIVWDQPGMDLYLFETSFSGDNCGFGDDESAIVELSSDGLNFVEVGIVCRDAQFDIAAAGLEYVSQIRISTPESINTPDGYDVDGVIAINGCSSTPDVIDCTGSEVLSYNPGPKSNGQPITDPLRLDPTQALGAPQLDDSFNFVSLGYGGSIVIEFTGNAAINGPGDDIRVAETTFGNQTFETYPESAEVFVSQNGVDFFPIGITVTNDNNTFDISDAGQGFEWITAVKLVDNTPEGSVSEDGYDVDGIEALYGCDEVPEEVVCEGVWRTQTQGGWGSPANGNNPGVYRDANFDSAFPGGLVVGCEDGFTLTLTSAAAVQAFLPSGGGPQVFDENLVDPTGNEGSFTGNLTALSLSVGFDNADPDFAPDSDFSLENLIVQSGNFAGWSVGQILAEANLVIGGCSEAYSPQQMNNIVDDINNAYTDGDDSNNGLLGCSAPAPQVAVNHRNQISAMPNPSNGHMTVTFNTAQTERSLVQIMDMNGRVVATLFNQEAISNQEYRLNFSDLSLPNGIYISQLITPSGVVSEKIMIMK